MKRVLSRVPLYLLWLLLSVMFWGWVFTRLTDAPPERKVVLFVEADGVEDRALAAALTPPPGLKLVQVHPFSYAMFDENTILDADLFVVRASAAAQYLDSFRPIEPPEGAACYEANGRCYGIRIYDAAAGRGAALSYIRYETGEEPPEDYYLFFGRRALHTGELDEAAFDVARQLMEVP